MRWLTTSLAAVLLMLVAGCDFGLTGEEAAAVESGVAPATLHRVAPAGDHVVPVTPATRQEAEEEAPSTATEAARPTRFPLDEPTPSYFPGIGAPIRQPPPPCPPE